MKSTLDRIVDGHLECAAWVDCPENSAARFSNAAKAHARQDCAAFIQACGPLVDQAINQTGYTAERFGHDFYLTRCGHGAGFWDRSELEVDAGCNVPCIDRDGRQYRACSVDDSCTLGDALTALASGTSGNISRFYTGGVYAYGGWLRFEGSPQS